MGYGHACGGRRHRGRRGGSDWGDWGVRFAGLGPMFRELGVAFDTSGRRRRGRSGRQRQFLKSGELQLLLLALIEAEPMHGYALIEAIETRTGGEYAPSPGIVYPTLTMLADMGLAEEQPEGSRKLYAITDKGRAHLDERRGEADEILARLDATGRPRGPSGDLAPAWRAMVNLGAALKLRMWERGADAETAQAIADILDEAAAKIEKI